MENSQRTFKVKCTRCGKYQGNCFAFCVVCGAKLVQKTKNSLITERKDR